MKRITVFIYRSKLVGAYSALSIYNNELKEAMFSTITHNLEILPIMSDLKIPQRESIINITKDHPLFVSLKNLGYAVTEHAA